MTFTPRTLKRLLRKMAVQNPSRDQVRINLFNRPHHVFANETRKPSNSIFTTHPSANPNAPIREEPPYVNWLESHPDAQVILYNDDVLLEDPSVLLQTDKPLLFVNSSSARIEVSNSTEIDIDVFFNTAENVFKQDTASKMAAPRHVNLEELGIPRKKKAKKQPPKAGEYFLYLFLTRLERDVLVGDLTEQFPQVQKKFGPRAAKIWFYKQVIWSIWPLVRKTVIKWGTLGWVLELIRKISS